MGGLALRAERSTGPSPPVGKVNATLLGESLGTRSVLRLFRKRKGILVDEEVMLKQSGMNMKPLQGTKVLSRPLI